MFDPTGPLPPAVYWRRRAVALGVVTLAVLVAAWAVFAFATGESKLPGERSPQPPPRAVAASANPPAEPPLCSDEAVRVTAEVAKPEFRVGERVGLRSVVTNVSDRACRRDLNRMVRELIVSKANGQRLWASNECYSESTNEMPVLQPGQAARNDIVWSGLMSTPDCPAQQDIAPVGDYHVVAKLGPLTSAPIPFRLSSQT
jgi:hypothetical protein